MFCRATQIEMDSGRSRGGFRTITTSTLACVLNSPRPWTLASCRIRPRGHLTFGNLPDDDRGDRKRLVGELRTLLATTCLRALEPDLIIMDEFQRFKHLLDGRDEASELARGLFEYEGARVLLVSATPYKMYTVT